MRYREKNLGRNPSPSQDKFLLRLPDGLRQELKAIAAVSNRTLTAEIVLRLQESLVDTKQTADQVAPTNQALQDKMYEIEGNIRLMWTEVQEFRREVNGWAKNLGK